MQRARRVRVVGWMRRVGLAGGLVGMSLVGGCGWFASRTGIEARLGAREEGIASWYGPGFHGRLTAAGEVFDQFELTAAHPSLPLGTRVLVTNLQNGRSVEVRINDRGPFARDRVIDLSYAAARALGMIGPGTVPVRLEVVGWSAARSSGGRYVLQLGTFRDRREAERLVRELSHLSARGYVVPMRVGNTTYYRVRVAVAGNHATARRQAQALARKGVAPVVLVERE